MSPYRQSLETFMSSNKPVFSDKYLIVYDYQDKWLLYYPINLSKGAGRALSMLVKENEVFDSKNSHHLITHNLEGPAIIYFDNFEEYAINNKSHDFQSWSTHPEVLRHKEIQENKTNLKRKLNKL